VRGEQTHAGGHWVTHQGRHIFISDAAPTKKVILRSSNAAVREGHIPPTSTPQDFIHRHVSEHDASLFVQMHGQHHFYGKEKSKFDPRSKGMNVGM